MAKINNYKIAWNTKSAEGIFILDTSDGVRQIFVNSAAEASMLLTLFRDNKDVYVNRDVFYTSHKSLEFQKVIPHEEAIPTIPEGVELIARQVSWVIPEKEKVTPVAETPKKNPAIPTKPKAKKVSKKTKTSKDKLRLIEGIGPKIEGLLHEAGILSFKDLAKAKQASLQGILDKAGSRYRMHDPSTWGEQAALAAAGKMAELKKWQKELKGGKAKN